MLLHDRFIAFFKSFLLRLLAMFPSPSTSTPFSVKDILNLEQNPDLMGSSVDCSTSSSSSCMLARLKQEPLRDMSTASAASLFQQDIQESDPAGRGNFAPAFYGKLSGLEMERSVKSDGFGEKRRKGEQEAVSLGFLLLLLFEQVRISVKNVI